LSYSWTREEVHRASRRASAKAGRPASRTPRPDLAGRILTRVDFTGEQSNGDPGGHGTHVAGLIAGNGASSNGAWTGVAPDANIVSVRVIDATGHAKLSWIFAGMQWVLANRNTYHIKVVNMSFGGTALTGYQNDLLASAAEMLNFAGLTVVAKTPFALGGTNLYAWKPGGRFVVTLDFHNSASVPVTITGVDSTPRGDWFGAISGPTLQNASGNTLEPVAGRFHPVRVPADGYRALAIVFHANPNPRVGCGTDYSDDSATLHFTTLGIFHNTQEIPLGDDGFYLTRRC